MRLVTIDLGAVVHLHLDRPYQENLTNIGLYACIAAGALAGLACGPGAPVCVTIGAFAGGAMAAFGAGFIW